MTKSRREAFKQIKLENPSLKISLSRLLEVCLCINCTNLKLIISALFRLMEDGESEGLQVFKGPEGEKPNFDPKELKKITVKIIRKTPQSIIPTLQRAIVDPATVVPVRRTGIS
nr:putative transformer protein [Jadera sanguinolenta]